MLGVAAALLPVVASLVAPPPAAAQTVLPGACTYVVTGSTTPVNGNGGTASISVATLPSCRWTATSMAAFISGGDTFPGSVSAPFTVQPNTTGAPRTGVVRVTFPAGNPTPPQDVTIRQDPVLGTGLIQATLRWDPMSDIDLHVIEPGGAHVFYQNKIGPTAQLETDNTQGLGPENIFVQTPVAGSYQFYIVHFSGPQPTTSMITLTVAGLAPRTIQRLTSSVSPSVGYNVAIVSIGPPPTITETTGTRASDEREGVPRKPR